MNCKHCNAELAKTDNELTKWKLLTKHIGKAHKGDITKEDYYNLYLNTTGVSKCKKCGGKLTFVNVKQGYKSVLCYKCGRGGYSEEKMILKYGEVEGKERWASYVEKQRSTNTFEYKQKKYGWTKEQFDEYNNTRSCTKKNFIKRHGKEEGTKKWDTYVERQAYAGVKLEYFIEEHGEKEGKKLYRKILGLKTHSLAGYIEKHGKEEGKRLYTEYRTDQERKRSKSYSMVSVKLFKKVIAKVNPKLEGVFAYGEFEKSIYDDEKCSMYSYDFTDLVNKCIIEFHGEVFHPKSIDDVKFRNPFAPEGSKKYSAETVWKRDQRKEKVAKAKGFDYLVVWEYDFMMNEDDVVERCIRFIYKNGLERLRKIRDAKKKKEIEQ